MRRETTELLRRLDHENISPRARVRALRPAAQQVVSIARALSQNVRLLIMDEPSSILDDSEVETLFGVVRRLTAEGVGVVYISHRLDEIPRIGSRVTVLSDGRTVATGLPADTPAGRARGEDGRAPRSSSSSRPAQAGGDDVLLEVRGLVERARRPRRLLRGPRGRGARHRRPGRRRAHRAAAADLRPRRARRRRGPRRRQAAGPRAGPRPAIAAGLGLAPEDRKSQGLLLDWSLSKNVTLADLGRFVRGGLISGRDERAAAADAAARAQHGPRRRRPAARASSPAATSRRSCCRAGCCTSAAC